jgi:carbamoyltransferase
MLFVFNAKKNKSKVIPSITHIDGTCRIQTVSRKQNRLFYDLIRGFKKLTGVPVILNTSFNIRGEPIVCTPQDALNDFKNTCIDCLVLNRFFIEK